MSASFHPSTTDPDIVYSVKVDNTGQRYLCLVCFVQPTGNVHQYLDIRFQGVVKSWRVNKIKYGDSRSATLEYVHGSGTCF